MVVSEVGRRPWRKDVRRAGTARAAASPSVRCALPPPFAVPARPTMPAPSTGSQGARLSLKFEGLLSLLL